MWFCPLQLYYILLTLQFYAVFPLFLKYLRKVAHHPWITLTISLILQILIYYIDFYYLQSGPLSQLPSVQTFIHYQDRIFLIYQFFFVLGGFAAIYMNKLEAFFTKYGKYLYLIFIATLTLFALNYFVQLNQFKLSIGMATTVFQPSVAIYSLIAILFFSYLAINWAKKRKGFGFIKMISDISFGIYFVHVMILSYITQYLLPLLSTPTPVKMISVFLLACATSVIFCLIIIKVPFLSWTIGRAKK